MHVNFADLPGFHNIFLDYLYEFEKVSRFFEKNFRDKDSFGETFRSINRASKPDRSLIVDILTAQYQGLKLSKQTETNIRSLSSPNTLTVVTGQQLTLFGGPLYTFYKIITAIKLSQQLKDNYDSYSFVPVFWLEGDDHDFQEIKWINIFNKENELTRITYEDGSDDDFNRGSVGSLIFNGSLNTSIRNLNDSLRHTEFTDSVFSAITNCYSEGKLVKQSFKELLHYFFDENGLIIIDPQDVNIKKLLKPVFIKEIDEFRKHTDEILLRSADLEESYHAQVKVKPINLFYSDNDGRFLVEPVEHEFRLKGKRKKFSKEEILSWIESEPHKFSPNVLLRPICQDYLLPTAFYVAGPGEISYFAQVMPYYKIFDLQQPIIYPRASATILEKNIEDILSKYELDLLELFSDDKAIIRKVLSSKSEIDLDKLFKQADNDLLKIIEGIKEMIFAVDPTLTDTANKTYERMKQSLETLQSKVSKAEEKKNETLVRQLNKAKLHVFPNNNFQEREMNFISFANKYGLDLIKWIYNELSINKFEHQILKL